MGIRTLVVANSGEVTQNISDVIGSHPDFELLANCRDGFEALQWMEETSPDLLLLDVELPGMNGFEFLDAVGPGAPDVIFLADSPEQAVRAFDRDAIDLIRKPISRERLHSALMRAKRHMGNPAVTKEEHISRSNRLLVRSSGKLVFLDSHEVLWVEASDNYVIFHTRTENHIVRMTMSALEKSLDPNIFVRVHRSTILNIEYVRELRPIAHGDYTVILRDGTELTMTRSYRSLLNKLVPSGYL